MDEFDRFLEKFNESLTKSRKHLSSKKLKQATKAINDCDKQIKSMDKEARHSDGVERRRLVEKIKQCKTTLSVVKQEYQQISVGGSSPTRSNNKRDNELYGNNNGNNNSNRNKPNNQSFNAMSGSNQNRARILENTATQKETDDLLADSQRIANETREIGTAALQSIEDQTDMLIEAKENVDQTHLETKKAGQLLNTMSRRIFTNKLFLGVIIFLLLGINVLILYFYHKQPSPVTPPTPATSMTTATTATTATPAITPQNDHVVLTSDLVSSLAKASKNDKNEKNDNKMNTKSTSQKSTGPKKIVTTPISTVPLTTLPISKTLPLQHKIDVGTSLKVNFVPPPKAASNRDYAQAVGAQASNVIATMGERFKEQKTSLRHTKL